MNYRGSLEAKNRLVHLSHHREPSQNNRLIANGIKMIIYLFKRCAIALLVLTTACSDPEETKRQEYVEITEKLVRAQLKDPDSARFRDLTLGDGGFVCGQLNAKNSYGGYNGFTAFFFNRSSGEVFIYDQNQDWRGKGYDARLFREIGCTIGLDERRALEAIKAIEESDRRIEEIVK